MLTQVLVYYSTPGRRRTCRQRTARLEFLDFLRTFLAGKLKIRTNLERRTSTVHSGHETCALHCFNDRRQERKSAGIEKIKNDPGCDAGPHVLRRPGVLYLMHVDTGIGMLLLDACSMIC